MKTTVLVIGVALHGCTPGHSEPPDATVSSYWAAEGAAASESRSADGALIVSRWTTGDDAGGDPLDAATPDAQWGARDSETVWRYDAAVVDANAPDGSTGATPDADAATCAKRNWYPDADSDGYGDQSQAPIVACESPGPGFVPEGTPDCYDANADARPGQTAWFSDDRGDGSFDYNCNGLADPERPQVLSCGLCDNPPTIWEAGLSCADPGPGAVLGSYGWVPLCEDASVVNGELYCDPPIVLPQRCGGVGSWKLSCSGASIFMQARCN